MFTDAQAQSNKNPTNKKNEKKKKKRKEKRIVIKPLQNRQL